MEQHAIIVEGESIEAAVAQAAAYLDCMHQEVAYASLPVHESGAVKIAAASLGESADGPGIPISSQTAQHVPPEWTFAFLARLPSPEYLAALQVAISEATAEYLASLKSEPMSLEPVKQIDGDVSISTGNIQHFGDVIIHGNALRGTRVSARGKLMINGYTESHSSLRAGGDLTVTGGILGTARSIRGDVSCRYAQAAKISGENVRIVEHSVQSQISAANEVDVGDVILGGTVYGQQRVYARVVGSARQVATKVTCGPSRRLHELANIAQARIEKVGEQMRERQTFIDAIMSAETSGKPQSVDSRLKLLRESVDLVAQKLLTAIYVGTRSRLHALAASGSEKPMVKISDRIFPNCYVEIDETGYEVRAETQFATIWKDPETGKVTLTPYE